MLKDSIRLIIFLSFVSFAFGNYLQRFDEAADAFYQGVLLDPENKELVGAFRFYYNFLSHPLHVSLTWPSYQRCSAVAEFHSDLSDKEHPRENDFLFPVFSKKCLFTIFSFSYLNNLEKLWKLGKSSMAPVDGLWRNYKFGPLGKAKKALIDAGRERQGGSYCNVWVWVTYRNLWT